MDFGALLGEVFSFLGERERLCTLNIKTDLWYKLGEVIPCSLAQRLCNTYGTWMVHRCQSMSSRTAGWSGFTWEGQVFILVYSAQPFQFVPDVVSWMLLVFQIFLCGLDYITSKWKIYLEICFQPIRNIKLFSLVNHLTVCYRGMMKL